MGDIEKIAKRGFAASLMGLAILVFIYKLYAKAALPDTDMYDLRMVEFWNCLLITGAGYGLVSLIFALLVAFGDFFISKAEALFAGMCGVVGLTVTTSFLLIVRMIADYETFLSIAASMNDYLPTFFGGAAFIGLFFIGLKKIASAFGPDSDKKDDKEKKKDDKKPRDLLSEEERKRLEKQERREKWEELQGEFGGGGKNKKQGPGTGGGGGNPPRQN